MYIHTHVHATHSFSRTRNRSSRQTHSLTTRHDLTHCEHRSFEFRRVDWGSMAEVMCAQNSIDRCAHHQYEKGIAHLNIHVHYNIYNICTCTYTSSVHVCVHVYMSVCVCVCVCAPIKKIMCVCACVRKFIYTYVGGEIGTYVCACVCICIQIYA